MNESSHCDKRNTGGGFIDSLVDDASAEILVARLACRSPSDSIVFFQLCLEQFALFDDVLDAV